MEQTTFDDVLRHNAQRIPQFTAYRALHRSWSFAQVAEDACRIAQALAGIGIGPGDRVACLTRHIAECTILMLAVNKLGAVLIPVNWRLAPPEVDYIMRDGESKFVMCDEDFLPTVKGLRLPHLRQLVTTWEIPGELSLERWSSRCEARETGYQQQPCATAAQIYTSGTTGRPKGVELSHSNLLGMCINRRGANMNYRPGVSVILSVAPSFHIGGFGGSLVVMYNGCTTLAFPAFDPAQVVGAISRHRVTHTFMVPAMINMLLQVPGMEHEDFSSLEYMSYGASPISPQMLIDALRVFKCKFLQNYGLTETAGTVVSLSPEDHDPNGPRAHLLRSTGKAVPGAKLRIVDVATGRDLPDGKVGEVWIHSPQNMNGYWHNEHATREAFPEGRDDGIGWFRSGDAGYMQDGYLYIQDRIKDMIISGAENIYPIEVENVLLKHPAVLDCAVIAVPDDKWGEAVKACVVVKPAAAATEGELIDFSRERLAHYKCPRSVDFVESLPRNASGKLLKNILREPYWKGLERSVG